METDSPLIPHTALDMSRHEDRAAVRRSVTDETNKRRRWGGIDDETKLNAVRALKVAMRQALEKSDHRAVNSCVQTLATLEGQNQADEHHIEKMEKPDPATPTTILVQYLNKLEPVKADAHPHDPTPLPA